ncbi:glycosyltransferase [candidate division CSSED10-310 bacterium]|uniref:Glycosyltransferase n=1 Tax=candidate division CSSED10-310 bacterium TaxID=2855610 RepID=A0ABV6YWC3_UNCC1
MTDSVLYSIIIPTFNGAETIERCLHSIFNQTLEKPFEVIIIDSSDDETPQIVRTQFPQAILISLEKQTPEGMARNIGITKAKGDIVVMTDQDCVVPPYWLSKIQKKMVRSDYDAIGGSIIPFSGGDLWNHISFLVEFNEFLPEAKAGLRNNVPTCNIAYRKEIFSNHLRFTDDFPIAEDLVFNNLLVHHGWKLYFDPDITIWHISRTGLKAALKHQYYLGSGSAKARKVLPELSGSFLIKYPVFSLGLPFYRWCAIVKRLARFSRSYFFLTILFSLPILIAVMIWATGFVAETFNRK